MTVLEMIGILISWNFFGAMCYIVVAATYDKAIVNGWELVNPYYVYKYNTSINWFGATLISLFFNIICPIGAICYWFHKLCTFGRKR